MSKTIGNIFDEKLTLVHLRDAYFRTKKNKKKRIGLLKYEMDLEMNLSNLLEKLRNGSYRNGKYRTFTICEPKERMIKALPFEDRIVHQWIVHEFIKPFFVPRFIKTSCACLDGRGTHYAVQTTQKYMRKMKRKYGNYYMVKCDIHKFFYSIDPNILYPILKKKIMDKKLLSLLYQLVYQTGDQVGIPIGNYTSQYFANIYLNEMDYYIKKTFNIKYYVRYMDDFILFVSNKEECRVILKELSTYLKETLHLQLNRKSNYYPSKMGIPFCGYHIFETHRLLIKKCKVKIKQQIRIWNHNYCKNVLSVDDVVLSWNSWIAHSSHCNSYKLQQKMYNRILFKDKLRKPVGK